MGQIADRKRDLNFSSSQILNRKDQMFKVESTNVHKAHTSLFNFKKVAIEPTWTKI